MIKIENVVLPSKDQLKAVIRGMRNPMNSWKNSDSGLCKGGEHGIGCDNCSEYNCKHTFNGNFVIGNKDLGLMKALSNSGSVHAKYKRMMVVYLDVTAPLYWWKEFDTYKVGTVANSCSTMHKITSREFKKEDFSFEKLEFLPLEGGFGHDFSLMADLIVTELNIARNYYVKTKDKKFWHQIIQLLPESYNQKRTLMVNYEVLTAIYESRKDHKLDEWRDFCKWIETLPKAKELIIGEKNGNDLD